MAGLLGHKFDGCPDYEVTLDRKELFDFTLPYLSTTSHFFVAPGNPSRFSVNKPDYDRFRIGKLEFSSDLIFLG